MDRFLPEIVGPHLQIDIDVKVFDHNCRTKQSFSTGRTYKAFTREDEELPDKPIYLAKWKQPFQICLLISYGNQSQLPVYGIKSISCVTPNGGVVSLDHEILNTTSVLLQAIATVDPSANGLKDHLSVCPIFGTVDERYRRMTLQITFRIGDHPRDTLVKEMDIFFMIVGPHRRMRFYKLRRRIQERWSQIPDVAKKGMRLFGRGIWKALEFAAPF